MGFVIDDHYVIEKNSNIKNPALAGKILTSGFFDAGHRIPETKLHYYRPLLESSFMLDYAFWGEQTFGYRLVNILFHGFNCVLVFFLIGLIFENIPLAAVSALLFCVFPVHEWSIRYIVGRGDLMQTFFTLISMTAVVFYVRNGREIFLCFSFFASAAAVLCREAALINVLYAGLIAGYLTKDSFRIFRVYFYFILICLLYFLVRAFYFPYTSYGSAVVFLSNFHLGISGVIGLLAHLALPASIQVIPGMVFYAAVLSGAFIVLLFQPSANKAESSKGNGIIIFGLAWMSFGAFSLLASQNLIERIGPVIADHFLYFLSIGFALLLAYVIVRARTVFLKKAVCAALLFYFFYINIWNGAFWNSEENLMRYVQKVERRKFTVAYEQLLMRFDDDESKIRQLLDRAATPSVRSLWLTRLGDLALFRKEYAHAIKAYGQAAALNPSNVEALNHLAVAYWQTGEFVGGRRSLALAIQADPGGFEAYRLLGLYYYRMGNYDSAVRLLQNAVFYDPSSVEAWGHLAMARYFLNDLKGYQNAIDKINSATISQIEILRFVAKELFSHQRYAQIIKLLAPAREQLQKEPDILSILNLSLEKMSD